MVQIQQKAPDFELLAYPSGESVRLGDFRGRWVVLYFYPKDMTPGCTREACGFRDHFPSYEAAGVVILGVSRDPVERHRRFAEKYDLPFTLLADTETAVARQYGVWVEKNMYGRKSMGIQRSTFLIDPEGIVRKIWPRVKVKGHVEAVLQAVQSLQAVA